jgi:hypothetical protein
MIGMLVRRPVVELRKVPKQIDGVLKVLQGIGAILDDRREFVKHISVCGGIEASEYRVRLLAFVRRMLDRPPS